jgi:hypothetical protein
MINFSEQTEKETVHLLVDLTSPVRMVRLPLEGTCTRSRPKWLIGNANKGNEPVNKGKQNASAISRGGKRSNDLKIVKRLLKRDNGISYVGLKQIQKDIKYKRNDVSRAKDADTKALAKNVN